MAGSGDLRGFDTRCGEDFAGRIVGPFRVAVLALETPVPLLDLDAPEIEVDAQRPGWRRSARSDVSLLSTTTPDAADLAHCWPRASAPPGPDQRFTARTPAAAPPQNKFLYGNFVCGHDRLRRSRRAESYSSHRSSSLKRAAKFALRPPLAPAVMLGLIGDARMAGAIRSLAGQFLGAAETKVRLGWIADRPTAH